VDLSSVFTGFEFVGAFHRSDLEKRDFARRAKPVPHVWSPGPVYVFQLLKDCDFEHLATTILPDRLRAVGAEVTSSPRSWRDMAVLNIGNPIWHIGFRFGHCTGSLWNRPDWTLNELYASGPKKRALTPDPRTDDYILELKTV
jgi:hypothetical protein